jgi:hypothetical protein
MAARILLACICVVFALMTPALVRTYASAGDVHALEASDERTGVRAVATLSDSERPESVSNNRSRDLIPTHVPMNNAASAPVTESGALMLVSMALLALSAARLNRGRAPAPAPERSLAP